MMSVSIRSLPSRGSVLPFVRVDFTVGGAGGRRHSPDGRGERGEGRTRSRARCRHESAIAPAGRRHAVNWRPGDGGVTMQTNDKTHRIAVIPGDGIGKEVVPEGVRVLDAVGRRFGIRFEWREFDWSCDYYARNGRMMPEDWF